MKIFKQKPIKTYEVGNGTFKLDFYVDEKNAMGNYLHIYTTNGTFSQKIGGYTYAYLWVAAEQGNISELEAYCLMLWRISNEIYQDLGFCSDIIKSINKRDKRLLKQAATQAKETTDEDIASAEVFWDGVVADQSLSKKEFEEKRKADKQILKEVIHEKD